jgi:uncharacterized membrane protein HdeD (DUF308 family)
MMRNESGIVDYDDDVTVVTVATDAPDNFVPPPAMMYQEKQGGRCCGICCDYRRAVIILGIISIITGILDFLMAKDTVYTMDDDELVQELEDLLEEYRIPNLVLGVLFIIFGIIAVIGGVRFSAKVVRAIFVFLELYCFRFRFLLPYYYSYLTPKLYSYFYYCLSFQTGIVVAYGIISLFVGIALAALGTNDALAILEKHEYSIDEGRYTLGTYFLYCIWTLVAILWVYPSIAFIIEVRKGIMTRETYPREEYSCCCFPEKY